MVAAGMGYCNSSFFLWVSSKQKLIVQTKTIVQLDYTGVIEQSLLQCNQRDCDCDVLLNGTIWF